MQLRGPHTIEVDGVAYPVTLFPGPRCGGYTSALRTVYVIATGQEGPGLMSKIGITSNLPERLATLQSASPVNLVPDFAAEWIERTAHDSLRSRHTHHEWFKCTPSMAACATATAASRCARCCGSATAKSAQ